MEAIQASTYSPNPCRVALASSYAISHTAYTGPSESLPLPCNVREEIDLGTPDSQQVENLYRAAASDLGFRASNTRLNKRAESQTKRLLSLCFREHASAAPNVCNFLESLLGIHSPNLSKTINTTIHPVPTTFSNFFIKITLSPTISSELEQAPVCAHNQTTNNTPIHSVPQALPPKSHQKLRPVRRIR